MEMTTPETVMKSSITFSKECLETDPDKDVEESDVGVHICEACGTSFETRKGLSSHARSHLRQLGVSASESSGAPIDVLYRLMKERGGTLPKLQKQTNPVKKPKVQPSKLKKGTGPKLKIKISNLVKKKYALSSSSTSAVKKSVTKSAKSALLHFVTKKPRKVSSKGLAMSSVSKVRTGQKVAESGLGDASPSTSIPPAPAKPLWAPQETDAPLNLTTMINSSARDDVQVCELCGAWYETRKGLSSHARAHLRQFGVPLDSTCGPIETLHKIIQTEEFKKKTSGGQLEGLSVFEECASPSSAHSTSVSILKTPSISQNTPASMRQTPPPNKKLKTSSSDAAADSPISGQTGVKSPSKGELSKNLSCEFCNETFKRSQCLASHARSHLRQLGITEWTVKGSPIATLRKVMAQRGGCLKPLDPSARSPPASPSGPAVPLLSPQSSSSPVPHKVPKARKGSRTVVSKPKDEPVEVDISILQPPKPPSAPTSPKSPPTTLKTSVTPLKLEKQEPAQFVYCEYCGEMFDTRKALSCHARAHLRQLGVKWSEKMPPIEALYELMRREGTERASYVKSEASEHLKTTASSPNTITPSPVDVTKDKTASDNTTTGLDATCELCGFDFENRKALASHARAHLRQLGVDWKTLGSPIETLRAWMKSEPKKVSDLHKRYLRGDLPFVKKGPRKPRSSDESVRMDSPNGAQVSAGQPQVSPPPKATVGPEPTREMKAGMSHSSSHRKRPASGAPPLIQSPAAHSNLNVRSARGCERRPPKHSSHPQKISEEMEPSKPSRTGNIPSLVPRPPETSLVKLVGKMYSLKCRFCEVVFQGPLSIQEDWVMHLQQHILKLKKNSSSSHQSRDSSEPSLTHTEALPLIDPQAV